MKSNDDQNLIMNIRRFAKESNPDADFVHTLEKKLMANIDNNRTIATSKVYFLNSFALKFLFSIIFVGTLLFLSFGLNTPKVIDNNNYDQGTMSETYIEMDTLSDMANDSALSTEMAKSSLVMDSTNCAFTYINSTDNTFRIQTSVSMDKVLINNVTFIITICR